MSDPSAREQRSLLSVQLYTVREALAQDQPGTLARLADLGVEQVEPFGPTAFEPASVSARAEAGLRAPSAHQHLIGRGGAELDELFAAAAAAGTDLLIDPFTPPERWSTREGVQGVARELAEVAAVGARHGVAVGYHNHAHEVASVLDGTTALEVLAGALDAAGPRVVLEVDTYWVAVGGQDPVALLRRLGDRVVALHLKDGPGTPDAEDQVALGRGSIPVADVVAAAPSALRVVELDDSRGDRFTAVADSVAWLREQGLA